MDKQRYEDIDWLKGWLVIAMVYCHTLQFFGDNSLFPENVLISQIINVLVFPSFMFLFGRTTQLAYLSGSFSRAWPRMVKQVGLLYGSFCISGISYRLFAENHSFKESVFSKVLLLQDIPGWSEFLISFVLFSLLMLVGFPLWQRAAKSKLALPLIAVLALLLTAVIPYGRIQNVYVALWFGGTGFSYFPVVPYLLYPLLGIYLQKHGMKHKAFWLGISTALSLAALAVTLRFGWPSRFPPSPFWIMLPILPICLSYLAIPWWISLRQKKLKNFPKALQKTLSFPGQLVSHLGKHSLYFLISSNILLFTLRGKNMVPTFSFTGSFLWRQAIISPTGALLWSLVMLALLWLILRISGVVMAKN